MVPGARAPGASPAGSDAPALRTALLALLLCAAAAPCASGEEWYTINNERKILTYPSGRNLTDEYRATELYDNTWCQRDMGECLELEWPATKFVQWSRQDGDCDHQEDWYSCVNQEQEKYFAGVVFSFPVVLFGMAALTIIGFILHALTKCGYLVKHCCTHCLWAVCPSMKPKRADPRPPMELWKTGTKHAVKVSAVAGSNKELKAPSVAKVHARRAFISLLAICGLVPGVSGIVLILINGIPPFEDGYDSGVDISFELYDTFGDVKFRAMEAVRALNTLREFNLLSCTPYVEATGEQSVLDLGLQLIGEVVDYSETLTTIADACGETEDSLYKVADFLDHNKKNVKAPFVALGALLGVVMLVLAFQLGLRFLSAWLAAASNGKIRLDKYCCSCMEEARAKDKAGQTGPLQCLIHCKEGMKGTTKLIIKLVLVVLAAGFWILAGFLMVMAISGADFCQNPDGHFYEVMNNNLDKLAPEGTADYYARQIASLTIRCDPGVFKVTESGVEQTTKAYDMITENTFFAQLCNGTAAAEAQGVLALVANVTAQVNDANEQIREANEAIEAANLLLPPFAQQDLIEYVENPAELTPEQNATLHLFADEELAKPCCGEINGVLNTVVDVENSVVSFEESLECGQLNPLYRELVYTMLCKDVFTEGLPNVAFGVCVTMLTITYLFLVKPGKLIQFGQFYTVLGGGAALHSKKSMKGGSTEAAAAAAAAAKEYAAAVGSADVQVEVPAERETAKK